MESRTPGGESLKLEIFENGKTESLVPRLLTLDGFTFSPLVLTRDPSMLHAFVLFFKESRHT